MMDPRFTDNDIQDYLEGVFTGDVKALEEYVQGTAEGKKRLDFYKTLFDSLQQGPMPSLSIALDDAVMEALHARQTKKSFNWNMLLWVVAILCVAGALSSCMLLLNDLSFFKQVEDSNLLPAIIVMVVLLPVAFHGIDWYRQSRRYKKWLG